MNSILPLLEAFLALGLTMIVLTTGVSSLVGAWQRALRIRAAGLRALLKCFFHLALRDVASNTPENLARFVGEMSLQPARLAEVEALADGTERNRRYLALLPDLAAAPGARVSWRAVWSSLGDTLDTLSEDEFKTRFKATTIGRVLARQIDTETQAAVAAARPAPAGLDDRLDMLYRQFVAYGHAATEDFARNARALSIVGATLLAVGANIDAFDLLETYLSQPTLRAAIIARYEQGDRQLPTTPSAAPASPGPDDQAMRKLDDFLKTAVAALPEQKARELQQAADETRQAMQATTAAYAGSRAILKDAAASFPVGWDRYPGCPAGSSDHRCVQLQSIKKRDAAAAPPAPAVEPAAGADGPKDVAKALAGTASNVVDNVIDAFRLDTSHALRWFTGVLLAILMLGLGAPFWIETVNGLLRVRDLMRGGNQAGDGSKAQPSAAAPPVKS